MRIVALLLKLIDVLINVYLYLLVGYSFVLYRLGKMGSKDFNDFVSDIACAALWPILIVMLFGSWLFRKIKGE